MISTYTSENSVTPREVKQRIKKKLAHSLKCLQKRYVNTDSVVTSDDCDANLLCCVMESIFVHGLKSKHIKTNGGKQGQRSSRAPLPQPVFWTLLKTVTHHDVVTELEQLNFINTDVGRCRAWVRLALNDGLMECYLVSLLREKDSLNDFYHPVALLLDSEDSEVLLSYLQGLSSLSFTLSYKSAVLNEWTATPLALAGLCSSPELSEVISPSFNEGRRKGSWDSVSQSSGSDIIEVTHTSSTAMHSSHQLGKLKSASSTLSLETTGSSQLSSSLSSDSLLQSNGMKSPDQTAEELWSCDTDKGIASAESSSKSLHVTPDELGEDQTPVSLSCNVSITISQHEVSSLPPAYDIPLNTQSGELVVDQHACDEETNIQTIENNSETECPASTHVLALHHPVTAGGLQPENDTKTVSPLSVELLNPVSSEKLSESALQSVACHDQEVKADHIDTEAVDQVSVVRRAADVTGQEDTLNVTKNHLTEPGDNNKLSSWISDDDICKPSPQEVLPQSTGESSVECSANTASRNESSTSVNENGSAASNFSQNKCVQEETSFKVTHRRKTGISNPFRGLLKLGNLERRGHVGIWKEYYCELSPFEFRLYQSGDDRNCCENCSLLRCELVGHAHSDGRFHVVFAGKKLYLRAPSRDEAEDWIDRIREALEQCRPLQTPKQRSLDVESSTNEKPDSVSETPIFYSADHLNHNESSPHQEYNWISEVEPQLDAIKETVLYLLTGKRWTRYIFTLTLEALKYFQLQEQQKILCKSYKIETFKDVIPDTALGGPANFKILTSEVTLRLQAESAAEARSWREMIRAVLSSYLEAEEDNLAENTAYEKNERRLVELGLGEHKSLLQYLTVVPIEKGLDLQKFQCAACSQKIGFSFSKAKVCAYSGLYYCEMCHQDVETIIPSRVIHNWDLTKQRVSNVAAKFLQQIQNEPFIDLDAVNGSLYQYVERMAQTRKSRDRLKLLEDYLFTCRSGAIQDLYKRLEQKKYLLESTHLYSVSDLRQIARGMFEAFLQQAIHYATNHVYMCDLCTQRGFICQVCNNDDIIFPFEFESTTRCKKCRTVFHKACKAAVQSCPRCVRKQKYLEYKMEH
ncbi:pleckstrin homology domain-containing family M member 1 isoform X1 [Hypanus sabinus]|uniref:pleckstrin homology domain-containing family M member 1 isoform X1 n=1 Tax=Hypanus sabinus TaxID=79690 RepID=UPI0028C4E1F1|nr:pleckstrin homology domain-containing family M member 1 isoform X1 [Hypanus sabinus]XP_059811677.1 pleckstrin homology domain-containing family M member 1 isoform X1 [Hypanus sabinus]XP_059811678.1 pleckstrin homology domain-containing family M member 1 isoform X1 [Hypanus sabinus]XP_059811679.1 pleckstrin homology domain-containing family M member 1 isoform X1 [Hypanus sabinus]